jgi:Flp pilus assembly pilin Flp
MKTKFVTQVVNADSSPSNYDPPCRICSKPVLLENSKTDETGLAIHEECYLLKLSLQRARMGSSKPRKRLPLILPNAKPSNDDVNVLTKRKVVAVTALKRFWREDEGQDIAEYAVMLAVILVIVVGTIRLVGSSANNTFSSVSSSLQ